MNWNTQIPTNSSRSAAAAGNGRSHAGRLGLYALSAAVAIALVAGIGVSKAQAGHKWIGPAIAGAIIGGVIAHHAYQHHRHYKPRRYYYHPHPQVVVRRHYRPRAYYGPVVVVPQHRYYAPPGYILYGP